MVLLSGNSLGDKVLFMFFRVFFVALFVVSAVPLQVLCFKLKLSLIYKKIYEVKVLRVKVVCMCESKKLKKLKV